MARAFPIRSSSTGTLSSIAVYVAGSSRTRTLVAALYSDGAGAPVRRLSVGSTHSLKAGAWNFVPMAHMRVRSGTAYWLVVVSAGGRLVLRHHRAKYCTSYSMRLAALPASWTGGAKSRVRPVVAHLKMARTRNVGTGLTHAPLGPAPTNTAPTAPGTSGTSTTPGVVLRPANVLSEPPTIAGTAHQGDTLTISSPGGWLNSPTSYAYQWQDCNTSGASCTNISGATSSSYTLQATDVGNTIRSVVTATNSGGSNFATSPRPRPVAGRPG